MAPQDGVGGFTMRQKLTAVGVVVVVIILLWQIGGLFMGNGGDVTPAAPQPKVANGQKPMMNGASNQGMGQQNPAGMQMQPGQMQPMQPQNPQGQMARQQSTANPDVQKRAQEQQVQQQQYLSTVSELQMLKLQKDIAETNQAIAAAKLATATAEKGVTDLFTKPVTQGSMPTMEDYASRLAGPGMAVPGMESKPADLKSSSTVVVVDENPYVVISVSMEMNKWSAVLGYQGKLYHVAVGDVLPTDGSVVTSISRNGVILKKNNVRKKVSLVPVI